MRALPLAVLVIAAVLVLTAPLVTIRVSPMVLFEGGAVRLMCRVLPAAANRFLEWGLSDYRNSRVELDGADAPITHEWTIERVPCDPGPAFCRVVREGGDSTLVTASLQVACNREGD